VKHALVQIVLEHAETALDFGETGDFEGGVNVTLAQPEAARACPDRNTTLALKKSASE
jgi:hypothetical protein